jgi:hypothetical protein
MTSPYPPWLNAKIQQGLQSGDQAVALQAALAGAHFQQNPKPIATRRMFDDFYNCIGEINDHIELQLNDPRQALPAGKLVLKRFNEDGTPNTLASAAMTCSSTVVPIVYDKVPDFDTWPPPYRWSGRVDVAHAEFKDAAWTVDCELLGDKHWLDRILCWPNPFLPIWIQAPAQWFGIGPGITVLATLIAEQAFRVQSGIFEILNDIGSLDLGGALELFIQKVTAFSSLTIADVLQVLQTPICVVPINPLTDTSAWIEVNGRMDTVWKLCQQQLQDNGFSITVTIWLPGDPQPAGILFPLTVATVVVELFDRSGFTGPFGIFEGLDVDAAQLEGALLGNALAPLLNPDDSQPFVETDLGEFIAPEVGVDFITPTVLFDLDAHKSGLIEASVDFHHPQAYQVVTGGQSPQWINDLINATLEWLIDSIMLAIGFTGIPDNILDGILDNVFFAFSVVQNLANQDASPYMFPEKFFPSGAGSLTLDTLFAEAQGLWNVRGYPAGKVGFIDGYPYTFGTDIVRDQLVLYAFNGTIFIDYIENVQITDNRTQFDKITLQIGDGKSEEAGVTKIQRKLVGLETFVNIILSGGNPQSASG